MKHLIHAPLFKIALCLIGGILLGDWLGGGIAWIALPAGIGMAVYAFAGKRLQGRLAETGYTLLLALAVTGLGALRYEAAQTRREGLPLAALNCGRAELLMQIDSEVRETPYGRKAWATVLACRRDSSQEPVSGRVQVYFKPELSLPLGRYDTLHAVADLRDLRSPYPDYLRFLERNGIEYAAYCREARVLGTHRNLQHYAAQAQHTLSVRLGSMIPDSSMAAIAQAMFLGDVDQLSAEIRAPYTAAGVSHILSISGMHIAMIYLFLNTILSLLHLVRHGQRIKYVIILALLLAYMLIAGAGPAVVRAVLMFGAVLLFRLFRQRYDLLNLMAIPALIQLAADPLVLFNIGFQLSYAAVLGIVLLQPWFEARFGGAHWLQQQFVGCIGVTLSATAATLPLVLLHFGQFPTYFILSNAALALVGFAVTLAGFAAILLAYVPGLSTVAGWICWQLLALMDTITRAVASLPHAVLDTWSLDHPAWPVLLMELGITGLLLSLPDLAGWLRQLRLPGAAGAAQPA